MAVQALRLAGRSTTDALNAALRGLAASVDEQLAAQMRLVEESQAALRAFVEGMATQREDAVGRAGEL